jgi:hypothetical protein
MSAGGLSYSGLTNYGVVTLPSVESWGTNMNIIRDPPKSITTRKINKVGDNSSINQTIDESGDRISEAIRVYALGVNPSVSVSYNNNGVQGYGGIQASLPYTVARDGAFRPPIRRQEDLLPLSRQSRLHYSAYAQSGFADFSRKLRTCGTAENTKEVITNTIKAEIRPTAVYKLERPLEAPRDVKHKIKNVINIQGNSGIKTRDITQQNVLIPTKEVNINPLSIQAQTQLSDNRRVVPSLNNLDTTRYTQDIINNEFKTNPSSNQINTSSIEDFIDLSHMPIKDIINNEFKTNPSSNQLNASSIEDFIDLSHMPIKDIINNEFKTNPSSNQLNTTSIEDFIDISDMPIKDIRTVSHTPTKTRQGEAVNYIHKDIELFRTLPNYYVNTQKTNPSIHKTIQHEVAPQMNRNTPLTSFHPNNIPHGNGLTENSSRDARLNPKIKVVGSVEPQVFKPSNKRIQDELSSIGDEKVRMSKMVSREMQGRFGQPSPFK